MQTKIFRILTPTPHENAVQHSAKSDKNNIRNHGKATFKYVTKYFIFISNDQGRRHGFESGGAQNH